VLSIADKETAGIVVVQLKKNILEKSIKQKIIFFIIPSRRLFPLSARQVFPLPSTPRAMNIKEAWY
jgi:hypothetical protein